MKIWFTLVFLLAGLLPLSAQTIEELEKELAEAGQPEEKLALSYQLGEAYLRVDPDKAMKFSKSANQMALSQNNDGMAARTAFQVAEAYERKKDDRNAEVWLRSALSYAKKAGDSDLIIKSVVKRSRIATKDRNYRRAYEINQEAFDYFSGKGTSISELENKYAMQRMQLEREKRTLEKDRQDLQSEIDRLTSERDQLSTEKMDLEVRQEELVQEKTQVEQEITEKEQKLASVSEEKELAEQIAQQAQQKAKEREKQVKQLSREALEKEAILESTRADLAETRLAAERNKNFTRLALLGAGFFVILAMLTYGRYRASRRAKKTLEEKNRIIQEERERSEELLLNILPSPIANELKEYGKARARRFEEVTVLFSDFKNFTRISEQLGPEDLVEELDQCFKAFDFIISQYPDIEKIKTIGDAYMCASGLTERKTVPTNLVRAALEMQEFLEEHKREKIRQGKPFFEARIGVHTGPVVAGVVGVKKFAYDIWGDTVNIAARVESNSQEGRVNISESTYNLIKYQFDCEYRGKVEAKNKGALDMYYVSRIQTVIANGVTV